MHDKTITMAQEIDPNLENKLYDDVCNIIEQARYRVAVYVNSETSMMNWNVGKRIKEDVLLNKRADYGEQVLKRLAQRLKTKYGSGWGFQKLQHCVRAAYTFSENEIPYTLSHRITYHLAIIKHPILLPFLGVILGVDFANT